MVLIPENVTLVYVIGAQKAGTSWLYHQFRDHTQIYVPPFKELHFFDTVIEQKYRTAYLIKNTKVLSDWWHGRKNRLNIVSNDSNDFGPLIEYLDLCTRDNVYETDYLDFLAKKLNGESVVADMTPDYSTLSPNIFKRMFAAHANIRFVFIMRDPIYRAWSQLNMLSKLKGDATIKDQKNFLYFSRTPGVAQCSNYERTIRNLESVVPKEKIFYTFYEYLFEEGTINKLYDFLDVQSAPSNFERKINTGEYSFPEVFYLQKVFQVYKPIYDFVFAKFGDCVPVSWRETVATFEADQKRIS